MEKIEIKTRDGVADCRVFRPANKTGENIPAIIFYMDAVGLRPAMDSMGQRFADGGYYVLMPNLYYRAGNYMPFNGATAFTDPAERERLMELMKSTDSEKSMSDTQAFLDYLDNASGVKNGKRGLTGYCMGGRIALTAAGTYPDRIAAIASIHGGGLATDKPESPHLLAGKITAKVYIGSPETDRSFTPEQRKLLEESFKSANVDYELEIYKGVEHGFAMPDLPAYNQQASEHHFEKVLELFGEKVKVR